MSMHNVLILFEGVCIGERAILLDHRHSRVPVPPESRGGHRRGVGCSSRIDAAG
ncbi:hypothetical protein [Arthrobacter methylotrophus]|uniref:hypothetical protein n=1 Tax=Arthrobacter methylotrophus TaxID=121291 RepID=UPI0031EE2617